MRGVVAVVESVTPFASLAAGVVPPIASAGLGHRGREGGREEETELHVHPLLSALEIIIIKATCVHVRKHLYIRNA